MLSDPITLYKLMILYMLGHVNFPLTNAQLTDFFLGNEYTSYFTLQQALNELHEAGLIKVETCLLYTSGSGHPFNRILLKQFLHPSHRLLLLRFRRSSLCQLIPFFPFIFRHHAEVFLLYIQHGLHHR